MYNFHGLLAAISSTEGWIPPFEHHGQEYASRTNGFITKFFPSFQHNYCGISVGIIGYNDAEYDHNDLDTSSYHEEAILSNDFYFKLL